MATTMKIMKETKERLDSLDLIEKGKTYDMIVNDLITYYQKSKKDYTKSLKKWKQSMKAHEKQTKNHDKAMKKYYEERKMWEKLFEWAKSKGFKG